MMDVVLPQLGESVTEGTLNKWLKQPGDVVHKYDPLVEVITDKVTAEVPADYDGTLTEILVAEGETVAVGTVICRISAVGESDRTDGALDPIQMAKVPTREARPDGEMPSTAALNDGERPAAQPAPMGGSAEDVAQQTDMKRRYSPAVLRLAEEHGLDLARVRGSGTGGRITRRDVLAFVQAQSQTPSPVEPLAPLPASPAGNAATVGAAAEDNIVDAGTIRKTIAKKMLESKQTAPHAWTMVEADVTSLVDFRQRKKAEFKRNEGIDLTYLPFFIKAVAEALKQFPLLNASWVENQIHMHRSINISIAVATDEALSVPVIHHADRLSLGGLAHAVNDLAARARSGRLQMADIEGGTFTVNNTGAFGSVLSQPIINMPQAAILSVESIVKRPVVVNDAIAIRSMVNLCLSLDHRLLDGWVSGQFLQAVKSRLEGFGEDTVLY